MIISIDMLMGSDAKLAEDSQNKISRIVVFLINYNYKLKPLCFVSFTSTS